MNAMARTKYHGTPGRRLEAELAQARERIAALDCRMELIAAERDSALARVEKLEEEMAVAETQSGIRLSRALAAESRVRELGAEVALLRGVGVADAEVIKELEADVDRVERMTDEEIAQHYRDAGEDLEEVAASTREVLLRAVDEDPNTYKNGAGQTWPWWLEPTADRDPIRHDEDQIEWSLTLSDLAGDVYQVADMRYNSKTILGAAWKLHHEIVRRARDK